MRDDFKVAQNQNGVVLQAANSRASVIPAGSSGNLGGIRPSPPIKTFGGDDLGASHLFTLAAISKEHLNNTNFGNESDVIFF